jgi:hypothetical protein
LEAYFREKSVEHFVDFYADMVAWLDVNTVPVALLCPKSSSHKNPAPFFFLKFKFQILFIDSREPRGSSACVCGALNAIGRRFVFRGMLRLSGVQPGLFDCRLRGS